MLAGIERATWLSSYCWAQELLYREYFANNDKYSDLNSRFVEDLVHLYAAILTFLIQAHDYYAKGAAGDSFFYRTRGLSHMVSSSPRRCHHKP
jgi:hypothetical protein